jgi:Domain of unknown function (DUF4262)
LAGWQQVKKLLSRKFLRKHAISLTIQIMIKLMKYSEADREASDQLIAKNISEFGCHIYSIFDPEEKSQSFTYSIGIEASTGEPEAIVMGVRTTLGGHMINEYDRQLREGVRFKRGTLYDGFIDGFQVYLEPARSNLLGEYTLGCERYYRDAPFSVVQIVWPSPQGVWPWQKSASDWFKTNQPMLGRALPNRK